MNMTSFNRFAVVLAFALFSSQAQAIEFSLVSGAVAPETYGNSYSATVDGLSLTASAWSTSGKHNAFETAELEIYPGYGMGVCNRDEGANCGSWNNAHALGNKGADDLILFRFSSAVSLDTLSMRQFGGDSDLSLWAGNGAISLNGMTPGTLGTASLYSSTSSWNTSKSVSLAAFSGTYDWLAVAARIGQKNDFAKLQSLTVNPVAQPVPEAATWMTMLAGLGLVGFAVGRRTRT
jgi:hypothetical protein